MPGVPDVYQGTELWDNSLVDPDNRRLVDFGAAPGAAGPPRRRLAAAGRPRGCGEAAGRLPRRCGCAATGRSSSPATGRCRRRARPPGTSSPSTAAGRSPWRPGCRCGWPPAAAGAAPPVTVDGEVTDVLTGRCHSGGPLPLADLLDRVPGGAARHLGPGTAAVTAFAVWAPYARRVRLLLDAEARRRPPGPGAPGRMMHRQADGWWRLSSAPGRPGYRLRLRCSTTTTQPLPDPRSAWQPAGVHGPSRVYDHDAFPWTDQRLDRPRTCPAASSTSCTSAPSPRRAPSTRPSARLDHLVGTRRRPRRAAAGQRLQRGPQLGLRRGLLVRPARAVRRPGRAEAVRRRRTRARPGRVPRRRLQPLRPVRGVPAPLRPLPGRRGAAPGDGRSTWTVPTPTRSAATSSTAR